MYKTKDKVKHAYIWIYKSSLATPIEMKQPMKMIHVRGDLTIKFYL